ncbi:MAG: GIY-YIG nuclease family protein [Calditrichaeota bacterium]|nr:GIY-YIG nuclease family protein [Calditrichota bacterium]
MARSYWVYIMANRSGQIYTGVTNDLMRRVYQHKTKAVKGFTTKYNIDKLVFFQEFNDVRDAISAERRIKGWKRFRKNELISELNPDWKDLSEEWFEEGRDPSLRSG